MFTEETPKDLSVKTNTNESEDKTNDNKTETTVESSADSVAPTVESTSKEDNIDNSMDLSVKKSVEAKTDNSEAEPMEVTLDLSMPSSSVEEKSEPKERPNSRTQQTATDYSQSSSPDVQMSEAEETPHMTNGNHMNGSLALDDSPSRVDVDEELPLPPLPQTRELSPEVLKLKQKRMRRLKQELRNEEMKLVLLKKLRQSQLMKENIVTNLSQPTNPNPTPPVANHSTVKQIIQNNMSSRNGSNGTDRSIPPMLNVGHNRSAAHSNKGHSVLNAPFSRNQSLSHGPIGPAHLGLGQRNSSNHSNHMPSAAHSQSLRPGPLSSMNRTPVTTPPNVVLGYPVQDLRAQQNSNNSLLNSHQSLGLAATGSPGPNSAEVPTQTPAQRQAAAKLALRKQLEKTLLQIPPPKPPPPEMHFIPNANNQEFVYYLGLETVVDFLTDSPNQNRPPPEPFECVQCGTDFTPVWKWQDRIDPNRDRPAVICETCVTSNIKKALKAEHTNRLKTAFVKALQQEQEIEQRIASGATSPPLPAMSPTPQQNNYNGAHQSVSSSSPLVTSSQSHHSQHPQAPPAHSSMPRLSGSAANAAAAAAAVASSAALLQQMPKLSAAHQSLFAAQAQQLHQLAQSLPQPPAAHMMPFAPLLAAQAYSYSMLGKSGVPSTDLHRQYLLDMIPSRSLPQGSINWKT